MAYNKKNLLKKIVDIQNITLEHTKKGVSQEWVFLNLITERFRVSRSTFYSYLSVNAKRELKKIEEAEKLQMLLF